MYPVWSKERKKRKSKIIDCHTLSVCPGPAENMGTVGTGQAEHRVTIGNHPNNYLLAAPLTLFDQGGQIMHFVLGCPSQFKHFRRDLLSNCMCVVLVTASAQFTLFSQ